MKEDNNITVIDSIDAYNRMLGFETLHPLVTVVDMSKAAQEQQPREHTTNYQVYALWLKEFKCGEMFYGRQPYDFQEGTVVSFAPGQVVHFKPAPNYQAKAIGLLFHPDLIHGTSLGKNIRTYDFFSYSSNEALHLSEDERKVFVESLHNIEKELHRPIDRHTRKIICDQIELLLDHCMRFYERQFVTRKKANLDVLTHFEELLDQYFDGHRPYVDGLPTVKYFASECYLSPNYFGDLVKRETGRTPQEYIQSKIIELAKESLTDANRSISDIAYSLGFQYSQHFNRYFKREVGQTPSQYRKGILSA
ncbi:MAG: helix-turn-helix domain-containing protein [Prevotella sp.]|jgi:AraC-like DNA-binding protein